MASLSEQIREIVKKSTVSSYAIAKQIGVSETLLGRFLSGERGLSLSTLDKLAEMFGIVAEVRTQSLPRPSKRGRKAKEPEMLVMPKTRDALKDHWKKMALACAKDAMENNFPSRRGFYEIADTPSESGSVLCLYNNNPWQDFENGTSPRRDKETAEFRKFLKSQRINELAYETWPPKGREGPGYTYAMLLDATEEHIYPLKREMERILAENRAEPILSPSQRSAFECDTK